MLRIDFLGTFQVEKDGELLTKFATDTTRALFIYLILNPNTSHSREKVATLLWPKGEEKTALNNLRQTLSRLRKAIQDKKADPPYLEVTRQALKFNTESEYSLDVFEFEACYNEAQKPDIPQRQRIHLLQQALKLYEGDLLPGFLVDSIPFEEWLREKQEFLHNCAMSALEQLSTHALSNGDYTQSIALTRRQLTLEPWSEKAHKQLITALYQRGDRIAALHQYETCKTILEKELDIEPSEGLQELMQEIKKGAMLLGTNSSPTISSEPMSSSLFIAASPLVGRQQELSLLESYFLEGRYPLITLTGAEGIGKTQLALELAERIQPHFPHGLWFVPLPVLSEEELPKSPQEAEYHLLRTIARALDCPLREDHTLEEQLLHFLRDKESLLILDHFSPYAQGIEFVLRLLEEASQLSLLVTSKEPLHCHMEYILQLDGFPLLPRQGGKSPSDSQSLQLFQRIVGERDLALELEKEAPEPLDKLFQKLGGVPYSIQLAAGCLQPMSIVELVEQLEAQEQLVSPEEASTTEQHIKSMQEVAWAQLNDVEQKALLQSSIFSNGFHIVDGQSCLSLTEEVLESLLDRKLIQQDSHQRWDMHSAITNFLTRKRQDPQVCAALFDGTSPETLVHEWKSSHSKYFLETMCQRYQEQAIASPFASFQWYKNEEANIRQAWLYALEHRTFPMLLQSFDALVGFCAHFQFYGESSSLLDALFVALHPVYPDPKEAPQFTVISEDVSEETLTMLWLKTLVAQAHLALQKGLEALSQDKIQEAIAWKEQLDFNGISPHISFYQAMQERFYQREQEQKHLKDAIQSSKELQEMELHIHASYVYGLWLQQEGAFEEALEQAARALQCANDAKLLHQTPHILYLQAQLQRALQVEDLGESLCQKALEVAATFQMVELQGELHILAAQLQRQQGQFAQTLHHLQQALSKYKGLGQRAPEGDLYVQLGQNAHELGQYQEAESDYQQALQAYAQGSSLAGQVRCCGHYAQIAQLLGAPQKASHLSKTALRLAQQSDDLHLHALAQVFVGQIYLQQEDFMAARNLFTEVRQFLSTEPEHPELQVESIAGLAWLDFEEGQMQEATTQAEELLGYLQAEDWQYTVDPFRHFWTCFQILDDIGDERAPDLALSAQELLQKRAATISNPNLQKIFLEKVLWHNELLHAAKEVTEGT